jgi:hypothetical protein
MAIFASQYRSFLIETSYQGKTIGLHWRLNQACAKPARSRQEDELYNQVQSHLNDLSLRTGFDYEIVNWGLPASVDEYVNFRQLELF